MKGWENDPELVATFRAEVDDRLTSLKEGLLKLEEARSPRQLVISLFRDAHTVKGSAKMIGLDGVVAVAHKAEDVLGSLRDGRLKVRKDLVDLLLVASDAISRALPGADAPVTEDSLLAVVAALDAALAGEDPVTVPQLARPEEDAPEVDVERTRRSGDSVRVPATRVHDLLDDVGEAELDVRRVARIAGSIGSLAEQHLDVSRVLRDAVSAARSPLPAEVGEAVHGLVALADQLTAAARELDGRVEDAGVRLARVRDGAMGLAMVPLRRVAAGFPQLVREVVGSTGKDVRLVVVGEDVELDSRVLDAVADALRHLVTNAVDHGCEVPAQRLAAGKPAQATVTVTARAAGSTVVIEVADDGNGIDEGALRTTAIARGVLPPDSAAHGQALLNVLFSPGFSTRSEVTETSGRGVGLDVVQTVVEDVSGTVEIRTQPGAGTAFSITLPVTLGVLRCLMARVGDERYALPVPGVVETVSLGDGEVHRLAGTPVLLRHGEAVPLMHLGAVVGAAGQSSPRAAIVVRYGGAGEQLAWAVDALEGELELVVKELGTFLGRLPAVGGATVDGDGSVVLVLDLRELAVQQLASGAPLAGAVAAPTPATTPDARRAMRPTGGTGRARVLVVEDSVGVRELQRVILEGAGYDVTTAVDGLDGAARLTGPPADLVLSDVEMPGMDGFTLTRTIRRTAAWANVPVVIMTSRGGEADRHAGLDAGADAYLLKGEFDQHELLDVVRRLVGR